MITNPPVKTKTLNLLSLQQKQHYDRDGFLVIKNFMPTHVCDLLMEHTRRLIENWHEDEVKTIFSTLDQHHAKTNYFLDSGDKIRFFFEENAFDAEGNLKTEKLFSINKIGHALHDLDPVFYCFSRLHKLAALSTDLDIIDPLIVQSMYICKQPYIGGEVVCHQDSTYLFVKGKPVTGFWFALQDATLENGCLWAIPGGHRLGLKSRMIRDKNDRIATETYNNTAWPSEKLVPLEVPRGSLIVLHGDLPHMSKENFSARSRHAYTLHVMSAHSEFAKDNWLKPPQKGFSSFNT